MVAWSSTMAVTDGVPAQPTQGRPDVPLRSSLVESPTSLRTGANPRSLRRRRSGYAWTVAHASAICWGSTGPEGAEQREFKPH